MFSNARRWQALRTLYVLDVTYRNIARYMFTRI